jgi:hypothetical protein
MSENRVKVLKKKNQSEDNIQTSGGHIEKLFDRYQTFEDKRESERTLVSEVRQENFLDFVMQKRGGEGFSIEDLEHISIKTKDQHEAVRFLTDNFAINQDQGDYKQPNILEYPVVSIKNLTLSTIPTNSNIPYHEVMEDLKIEELDVNSLAISAEDHTREDQLELDHQVDREENILDSLSRSVCSLAPWISASHDKSTMLHGSKENKEHLRVSVSDALANTFPDKEWDPELIDLILFNLGFEYNSKQTKSFKSQLLALDTIEQCFKIKSAEMERSNQSPDEDRKLDQSASSQDNNPSHMGLLDWDKIDVLDTNVDKKLSAMSVKGQLPKNKNDSLPNLLSLQDKDGKDSLAQAKDTRKGERKQPETTKKTTKKPCIPQHSEKAPVEEKLTNTDTQVEELKITLSSALTRIKALEDANQQYNIYIIESKKQAKLDSDRILKLENLVKSLIKVPCHKARLENEGRPIIKKQAEMSNSQTPETTRQSEMAQRPESQPAEENIKSMTLAEKRRIWALKRGQSQPAPPVQAKEDTQPPILHSRQPENAFEQSIRKLSEKQ